MYKLAPDFGSKPCIGWNRYVKRGLWLRNPQYCNASGSGVNRCQFYSTRIGQFVNTGIQIDAGGTNASRHACTPTKFPRSS